MTARTIVFRQWFHHSLRSLLAVESRDMFEMSSAPSALLLLKLLERFYQFIDI